MAPKRPADAYTTSSFPTDRSTTSLSGKRTRYAPPNASKILGEPLADDLELDLEGTGGTTNSKKNKIVVTEGYDSDSSGGEDDDISGFGGGKRRKETEKEGGGEDDDQDMFGGGPEKEGMDQEMNRLSDKSKEKEKEKGKKEWLEMGDIEGQEFSKRDMKDDDDDDDQGEGDEDEDLEEDYDEVDDHANDDDAPRSRRSKKGMGFQLSSFNMKEELAEGRFSADGSYVANTIDPLASHDTWLNGLSKVQIRQAKEAKERMDAKNREREKEEQMRGEEQLTQLRDDCLIGLLSQVREGETVAGALNRLGRNKKRAEQLLADQNQQQQQQQQEGGGGVETFTSSSISRYTNKINRLTHFASTLLSSHGELEIYDQSYEDIIKTLKMEGAVRRDWAPPKDSLEDQELERKEEIEWKERERLEKEQNQRNRDAQEPTKEGRSRVVISRPTTTSTSSKYWYKWNPAPEGQNPEEKYGPFERSELESWINQGYFGDNQASRILLRRDGDSQGEFKSWNEVK